jgi:DNA-binding GntR family transcriptional regulator
MAKENLEDTAYRLIIRMIVKNHFKPGDYLLETELSKEFKLSRTPVRQALGRLITEGFLEKKPKKGCVIPIPSADDAKMVFDARCLIEGEAAALAALNASKVDINSFRDLLKKELIAVKSHNRESYSLTNEQFHFGIAKACGNSYIEQYCRNVFWRSNLYIFFFDNFYFQRNKRQIVEQGTPDQHEMITNAIEDKDSDLARSTMKAHIKYQFAKLLPLG